jgi:hypothetical protein
MHRTWNGYPAETLERQWAVEWREDQKEQNFFSRRRSIRITITNFPQKHNITIKTAANVAEEN